MSCCTEMENLFKDKIKVYEGKGYRAFSQGEIPGISHTVLTGHPSVRTLKEKGRMEKMSFAGITFTKEKIVAFSDSKSTKFVNGQPMETSPVRKVFGNDAFVVTCTGSNAIPVMKDDCCSCMGLDDWMDEKIEQVDSVWELCKSLYEFLHKECIQNIEPIILIGAQPIGDGKDVCKFFTAKISRQSFVFEEQFVTEAKSLYSGADEYIQYFNQNPERLLNGSVDILETELKNAILKIQDLHGPDWYNPVGGKIQIATL